jgi:hypothetical protein
MGKMRNAYLNDVGADGEGNNKMGNKEMGCGSVAWSHLGLVRVLVALLVNTVSCR